MELLIGERVKPWAWRRGATRWLGVFVLETQEHARVGYLNESSEAILSWWDALAPVHAPFFSGCASGRSLTGGSRRTSTSQIKSS